MKNEIEAAHIARDRDRLADLIGIPFGRWAYRCHEISTALLRTGVLGPGRIARGRCRWVTGQHSWIVLGDNVYDPGATVWDATLWSYGPLPAEIWVGRNRTLHIPHGAGSCLQAGMPCCYGGDFIELTPETPLSGEAESFLDILGPLDYRGWAEVAHLPVEGWPAAEIIDAMWCTRELKATVPIDIAGMLTNRLPEYWYRP